MLYTHIWHSQIMKSCLKVKSNRNSKKLLKILHIIAKKAYLIDFVNCLILKLSQ